VPFRTAAYKMFVKKYKGDVGVGGREYINTMDLTEIVSKVVN
jgi:hypothetical protein